MPESDVGRMIRQPKAKVRKVVAVEGVQTPDGQAVSSILVDLEVKEGTDATLPLSKDGSLALAVELTESHRALEKDAFDGR